MAIAFGQQPTLKEHALPAIKGSILLPDGWNLKEEAEDGVTVYQISREKGESEEEIFSTGLILSVTTKVPDRASMKPSEYARDLLTSAQEEGGDAKLEKTQEGPLECLRLEIHDRKRGGKHQGDQSREGKRRHRNALFRNLAIDGKGGSGTQACPRGRSLLDEARSIILKIEISHGPR